MKTLTSIAAAGLTLVAPAHALAVGDDSTPDTSVPTTSLTTEASIEFSDVGDPAQQATVVPPTTNGAARITDLTTSSGRVVFTGAQPFDTMIEATTTSEVLVEIVTVDDDGSSAGELTVESFETDVAEGGELASSFAFGDEWAALEGMTLGVTYSPARSRTSVTPPPDADLTAEQQAAIDELNEDSGDLNEGLPTEPVGVGAQWTTQVPIGGTLADADFRLASASGSQWVLEFEIEAGPDAVQSMDVPEQFDSVSGTIVASGSISGDSMTPYESTTEMTMDFDVTFSGPDGNLVMDLQVTREQTVTPG